MRVARASIAAVALQAAVPVCAVAQAPVDLPVKDRTLQLDVEPVFRVGSAEGAEWETFATVYDVAFDRAGNLYVLDALNQRIHVFDRRGRHLRSLGRRGGGPGELQASLSLTITADGELVVNDAAHGALVVFGTDGEYVRTARPEGGRTISGRIRAHPRGGVVGAMRVVETRFEGALPTSTPPQALTWLRPGTSPGVVLYNAPPRRALAFGPSRAACRRPCRRQRRSQT